MAYVVGKFMTGAGIKGHETLLTGDKKILSDNADKTKPKGVSKSKLLNKTAYNELILA